MITTVVFTPINLNRNVSSLFGKEAKGVLTVRSVTLYPNGYCITNENHDSPPNHESFSFGQYLCILKLTDGSPPQVAFSCYPKGTGGICSCMNAPRVNRKEMELDPTAGILLRSGDLLHFCTNIQGEMCKICYVIHIIQVNGVEIYAIDDVYSDTSRKISGNENRYFSLQHIDVDDVLLFIFQFLTCTSLSQVLKTCHRFYQLAHKSAEQRTHDMRKCFCFLDSNMKLLRVKEQILGVQPTGPVIRVPLLGLEKRVLVSHAGDDEFNGIYFCTECNGNGFLFSKPRLSDFNQQDENNDMILHGVDESIVDLNLEGDGVYNRCIISKRFSNETILWYMSKEVKSETGTITQTFYFWAKLMSLSDASSDQCRYPSQTSILSRNGEQAWQSLSNTRTIAPPIVELIDNI